jgi:serine/threonine-protein kinase HipA
MRRVDELEVCVTSSDGHSYPMGRLARNSRGTIAFTPEGGFLQNGLRLSPFFMPSGSGPFVPRFEEGQEKAFHGLFGVFADSLPDAFGMAVARRSLSHAGFEFGALELLSYIGDGGRGCLSYKPVLPGSHDEIEGLQTMFDEARSVAEGLEIDFKSPLAFAMGTTGGTRPKVHCEKFSDGTFRVRRLRTAGDGGETCIVKFDCTGEFAGRIDHETKLEAAYLSMARACGLRVPEFELVEREGRQHLVLKRFDRTLRGALHMHSFWGLVHAGSGGRMNDYEFLHRASLRLTGDVAEVAECYGRMVFNVLACNQDDHAKQHAFLFDGDKWRLSPAFDLTFSPNPTIGHALTISGKAFPADEDLIDLGVKMDVRNARDILERVKKVISTAKMYLEQHGVPAEFVSRVQKGISDRKTR